VKNEPVESTTRRSFFGTLVGAISAVVGALMAIPLIRFAAYPVFHGGGGADWFPVGKPDNFTGAEPIRAVVEVRKQDGWRVSTTKQTVWITRDDKGELKVLSAVCSHLGCVVPWTQEKQMFVCPCHKGFFGKDGARVSGPPPRGLDVLPSKIENGTLYVKYQYFRNLVAKREVIG
jgi:menaquinol-cytochrome c reductase iron-sulfur subunit